MILGKLVLDLLSALGVRLHDFAFVALVAFGAGWTIAALALEILAASDSRSILWLACSRFFLGLACLAFGIALVRSVWRARHQFLRSWWLVAASTTVVGLSFVSVGYGHVVTAWLAVIVALTSSFAVRGRWGDLT